MTIPGRSQHAGPGSAPLPSSAASTRRGRQPIARHLLQPAAGAVRHGPPVPGWDLAPPVRYDGVHLRTEGHFFSVSSSNKYSPIMENQESLAGLFL